MKIPLLLTLAALCVLPSVAHAQLQGEGRFVFDALPQSWIGTAPIPADTFPLKLQSNFDPKLPALPGLDELPMESVKLSVMPTYKGQMLQVEASNSSMSEILRTVTAAWGMRAVIDPMLAEQHLSSAVFRALTPQDLLDIICEFSVKQLLWSDGTLFFVDKVNPDFTLALSENRANSQLQKLIAQHQSQARRNGPFSFGPSRLTPIEPQPGWEKREFNGHDFYFIPAPNSAQSQGQKP